jgi:ABC-2 type transport system ATP-binding protein
VSQNLAVEAVDLSRNYGERTALDHVSLSAARGEIFALLGPNGGGKTTLFRILSTLLPPTSGRFCIDGMPGTSSRDVRRKLGVVFQSPSLDSKLTVRENLAVQGILYGLSGKDLSRRIDEVLRRFSILDRANDRVETLSGGLARRAEVAKALLHAPPVLLLDEPSTGLDPGARRDLVDLLAELAKAGTAVLLTTHLFEEAEAAHRLGILDRGRLIAEGTPAELKRSVGGDVVAVDTAGDGDAARLLGEIRSRFGTAIVKASVVGPTVRLELPKAHEFIPPLVEAFPGRFRSVTLGAPSLEDVFVERTGRRFRQDEGGEAEAAP